MEAKGRVLAGHLRAGRPSCLLGGSAAPSGRVLCREDRRRLSGTGLPLGPRLRPPPSKAKAPPPNTVAQGGDLTSERGGHAHPTEELEEEPVRPRWASTRGCAAWRQDGLLAARCAWESLLGPRFGASKWKRLFHLRGIDVLSPGRVCELLVWGSSPMAVLGGDDRQDAQAQL